MSGIVMRHFVKCLFSGRAEALVYQVDEQTSARIRRNLSGDGAGFCCFTTLDGRDVAVNLAGLDLIHFLWDAASPELSAIEHHPTCVYFVDRALWSRPSGCAEGDSLDAFAAAWTAARIVGGQAVTIPDPVPRDRHGLPMRMVI